MNEQHLNLARAWRSKTFDELVGQELSVRVLKNSLFKNYIFPVYLFAGLRGCGKTTTARIFAAALNCEKLEQFQQHPQATVIPCLQCVSCKAMAQQQHPDFIEMDAASHTGVDNVRTIIDSASLLPSLGKKKIYLIDEAHMLSKAAFNAFLKLLEEPPLSVVFLLATTELHKIPETVRSRCLQLFFPALPVEKIVSHLAYICEQEHIVHDTSGLLAVARAGQGSMRDALNIVERIRFAAGQVTGELTASLLGSIDLGLIVSFFEDLAQGTTQGELLIHSVIKKNSVQPLIVWQAFVEFLSFLLTASYGVSGTTFYDKERIEKISALYSQSIIIMLLDLLYEYEPLFIKTTQQSYLLDLVIMKMKQIVLSSVEPISSLVQEKNEPLHEKIIVEKESAPLKKVVVSDEIKRVYDHQPEEWRQFVERIDALQETVISSVFKQAQWKEFQNSVITVQLDRKMSFFKDIVEENKIKWQPFVEEIFGASVTIVVELIDGLSVPSRSSASVTSKVSAPIKESFSKENSVQKMREKVEEKPRFTPYKSTVSSQKQVSTLGPQAKKLLEHFPGTVTEYKE